MELSGVGDALRRVARKAGHLRHYAAAVCLRVCIKRGPVEQAPPAVETISRLLILRLDEIGDFVLTTPFLRCIRNRFPRAWIAIAVSTKVLPLARDCPYVDEVIAFETVNARAPFDQFVALMRARRFGRECLARKRFDCAVIPRADIDVACAAAMAYFAGIRNRIGFAESVLPLKRIKNAGYDRFLTHPIERVAGSHEVEWCLGAAAYLGADVRDSRLELWPSAAAKAAAGAATARVRRRDTPLVAVAPGAGIGRRRWPAARYASVVEALTRNGLQVVVLGGGEDRELAAQLCSGEARTAHNVLDLTGGLRLDEAAAVLGLCGLFLGNDSGPMHLAAAMGVPCVVVSCHSRNGDALAANSPVRFGPWAVKSRVLQPERAVPPCRDACVSADAHCIEAVSVAEALAAVSTILDRSTVATGCSSERYCE